MNNDGDPAQEMILPSQTTLYKLAFSSPFRRYSLTVLSVAILVVLLNLLSPLVQRQLIDSATNRDARGVLFFAFVLASIMGGTFFLNTFTRWIRGLFWISARRILKGGVFRHLLALPEEFLRSRGAGYFFNRVQNDIGEVVVFLYGGCLAVWPDFLKLVLAYGVIIHLSPFCALLAGPFLALQVLVCLIFRKKQYHLSLQMQECVASERHIMQEFLANHTVVKTHAATESAGTRVESGLKRWGTIARQRLINENWFLAWLQFPVWLCTGTVAVYGLLQVVHHQTTLGEVWALIGLLNLVFAPARSLAGIFVQTQSARSAWTRLREILSQETEQDTVDDDRAPVYLTGTLEIHQLDFSYDPSKQIFRQFSLTVPYGTTYFITGANGSGKSTLLALLLRLYEPQNGEITIGGISIASFPLKAYRSRIGYLGQHPEFIAGTLRDNLLLGNPDHSDEEIIEVFRSLNALSLLDSRSRGLDSAVAEKGENFSGGERLRLALVRELLRDTDILIFDEPAAHLDQEGKEQFYELLSHLPGGKTVLAVVHDLPENVEHLIRLEKLNETIR